MRHFFKILFFCFALSLFSGCSAQRRIQRIVERHPELIEVKYRTIDTFLSVPGFTDQTVVPMSSISYGSTYYETTDNGTFVVSFGQKDSTLHIGFVAENRQLHFQDTVKYRQIVINPEKEDKGWFGGFGERVSEWIAFLVVGMCLAAYLLRKSIKNKKQ